MHLLVRYAMALGYRDLCKSYEQVCPQSQYVVAQMMSSDWLGSNTRSVSCPRATVRNHAA